MVAAMADHAPAGSSAPPTQPEDPEPQEEVRDWAGGLPGDVLAEVARRVAAAEERAFAARLDRAVDNFFLVQKLNARPLPLGRRDWPALLKERLRAKQFRADAGRRHGLFPFAMVCGGWRRAQRELGGGLRTRLGGVTAAGGESGALREWLRRESLRAAPPGRFFPEGNPVDLLDDLENDFLAAFSLGLENALAQCSLGQPQADKRGSLAMYKSLLSRIERSVLAGGA